jgi:hypothetical protein
MGDHEILVLKDKVQRYLSELVGTVEIDRDGDFTLRHGSSRVFVRCAELKGDRTYVAITVPLLFGCQASPELFRHVATHADDWVFGHLSAHEGDDGVAVFFTHRLLGDYLDPEELKSAVGGVAATADDLDNELQGQFGGRRFHEDGD